MEVKELMIDDLVDYNGVSCYVSSIENLGGLVGVETEVICEIVADTELQPIPLTTEILEKNGWVNKEEKGWMQKGNFGDSPLMLWYIKDTGKFNPHFANELEMSDLSKAGGFRLKVQCKYVHQLQHALRAIGLADKAKFKVR